MEITLEQAYNTINTLINKSVVEGSLIIAASNSLTAMVKACNENDQLKKESELLKKRVEDLELEIKSLKEK